MNYCFGDAYVSEVVRVCRQRVRESKNRPLDISPYVFIAYSFRPDGYYHKYYLPASKDNLARFICSSDSDKLICSADDYAIFNTQGKYIDLVSHDDPYFSALLGILEKYQDEFDYTHFEHLE